MPALPTDSETGSSLRKVDIEVSTAKLIRCRPFSDVYDSEVDGQAVCIELVRWPEDLTDMDAVKAIHARILKEMEQCSNLSHDNILPFKGHCDGIRGPLLGLISKRMPDGRILQFLENHPEADRLSLLIQCAEGLAYLHTRDMVHSDITSDNILVSTDGDMPRAYLYGFGIPKVLAGMVYSPPLLKRGEVILPPELAAVAMTEPTVSESFTTATDVWSFGILAYQIFTDGKHAKVWEGGGKTKLEPYLGESRGMTPELWKVIQSCCERKPSKRPSMHEICTRLKELQNSDSVPPKDPKQWCVIL